MSNDNELYKIISDHQIFKWFNIDDKNDLNFKLPIELLPEFELIVNGAKMKVWEILVASKIITSTDLNHKLLSQNRIAKFAGIKPRILDLVYWDDFEEKIEFLESHNRNLLLWEKLIKEWLINSKTLFSILVLQKKYPKKYFWEILLSQTNYDSKIINFLEKCGYLTYEEIDVSKHEAFA